MGKETTLLEEFVVEKETAMEKQKRCARARVVGLGGNEAVYGKETKRREEKLNRRNMRCI